MSLASLQASHSHQPRSAIFVLRARKARQHLIHARQEAHSDAHVWRCLRRAARLHARSRLASRVCVSLVTVVVNVASLRRRPQYSLAWVLTSLCTRAGICIRKLSATTKLRSFCANLRRTAHCSRRPVSTREALMASSRLSTCSQRSTLVSRQPR